MSVCVCASVDLLIPDVDFALSKLLLQLPFLLAALIAGLRGVDLRSGFGIVDFSFASAWACAPAATATARRRGQLPQARSPRSLLTRQSLTAWATVSGSLELRYTSCGRPWHPHNSGACPAPTG